MILSPGLRSGKVTVPVSKSHAHRVFIADFLAGGTNYSVLDPDASEDLHATVSCLTVLSKVPRGTSAAVTLDCGESGTTRRLLGPVVAALGLRADWRLHGRLAARPQMDYDKLRPGVHVLPGDVSSQFVSGLLFALPLLDGDSEIRFSSPLASRGYVDLTGAVLAAFGVRIDERSDSIRVPGRQVYRVPVGGVSLEADWSGAAFWLAMNALGNHLTLETVLSENSLQPDRAVVDAIRILSDSTSPRMIDVDAFPDSFPVLSIVAALSQGVTRFTGIRRLRLKESDRVEAMREVLTRFGVHVEVTDAAFTVQGDRSSLKGGVFSSFADHRIAMSIAVGATRAESHVEIDDVRCADKSFPGFFNQFNSLHVITSSRKEAS